MIYPVSVPDVLSPERVTFSPVVDLGMGEVVAVETHGGPDPARHAATDPAEDDIRRLLRAARATAQTRTHLPLLMTLRAETVAAGRVPLTMLHRGLRESGRRPQEVILCMYGGFAPAQRPLIRAGIHGLHSAGYLIGFAGVGAAHAPLDLLLDAHPYVMKLDAELSRKAGSDPRYAALVDALVNVAHRIGSHVLAPGVASEEHLARLRAMRVRLAQGPLLTPAGWRPAMGVKVPIPLPPEEASVRPRVEESLGPRVSEFVLPAVTMPVTVTADGVLTVLNADRGTTSIVLVDEQQRPRHTIDRTRFLLAISGAYGHALHAQKPAARLADPPRLVPRTVPAIAALRAAGEATERVYDDLVVTDEVGRCVGVVRVADLIRSVTP
jgi:EAL domain-containing protein (putative c-di-GMP-specific phosphodiesterase class I)